MLSLENLYYVSGLKKNTGIFDYIDDRKISNEDYYFMSIVNDFETMRLMDFSIETLYDSMFHMGLAYNAVETIRKHNSNESFEFTNKYNFNMEGVLSSIGEGIKKVWEFIKGVFKKIFNAIASFFKWIASFFKRRSDKEDPNAGSKKKENVKKAKEILKKAGIKGVDVTSTESDDSEISAQIERIAKKITAPIRMRGTSQNRIFNTSAELIVGNGENAKFKEDRFNAYLKSTYNHFEDVEKNMSRYSQTVMAAFNADTGTKTLKFDKTDIFLDLDIKKSEIRLMKGGTNFYLQFYGTETPKVYTYSAVSVLEQIPSNLLQPSSKRILEEYVKKFKIIQNRIEVVFKKVSKEMDESMSATNEYFKNDQGSDHDVYEKDEIQKALNVFKTFKVHYQLSAREMISCLKETLYIIDKGMTAHYLVSEGVMKYFNGEYQN